MLDAYLDDLESRIDESVETALWNEWRDFYEGRRSSADLFLPRRPKPVPPRIPWPTVSVNDAFADPTVMLLQQFRGVSDALEAGAGQVLCVRCNYSTAILPSQFGTELFMMDPALNTLPTAKPLAEGVDAIRALLDRGAPNIRAGLGAVVFETAERFREIFQRRPKLGRHVRLYHPDLQGPMDACELIWGSSIFYAAYDEADLVQGLLRLVTEAYERFMDAWLPFEKPDDGPYRAHWSLMMKGRVMLRDDSAMNFSPEMYDTFIAPYDSRLLKRYGGAIHFCGRGDHYIDRVSEMEGLTAIQMSQPECNTMDKIFEHTVDKGIPLVGFNRKAAEEALASGRRLKGLVHCW